LELKYTVTQCAKYIVLKLKVVLTKEVLNLIIEANLGCTSIPMNF